MDDNNKEILDKASSTKENDTSETDENCKDLSMLGIPAEVLKGMPPEAKKTLLSTLQVSMQGVFPGPKNPIFDKIDKDHISKVLELAHNEDERDFKKTINSRWFNAFYAILFVILFVFLTIYVGNLDKELYKEIIKILLSFLGGLGSGYGLKGYLNQKDE